MPFFQPTKKSPVTQPRPVYSEYTASYRPGQGGGVYASYIPKSPGSLAPHVPASSAPAASTGRNYAPYTPAYQPRPALSTTPDQLVLNRVEDASWYADALTKPRKMSQTKHSQVGLALKRWRALSANDAAKVAERGMSGLWIDASDTLSDIFATLPDSRRRGVAQALHQWSGRVGDLENNIPAVRTAATLLASRAPADLQRDTAAAKRLTGGDIAALGPALAWLGTLPPAEYDEAISGAEAFLASHAGTFGPNAFYHALTIIGPKHQAHALKQYEKLHASYAWPHRRFTSQDLWQAQNGLLLAAVARVSHEQRRALVDQTKRALSTPAYPGPKIANALAVPTLLSQVLPGERDDLADALGKFYNTLPSGRPLNVFEFFTDLKKLPDTRRGLYLETLAGCYVAAVQPDYRPNDIAVTALWLYYGQINHLHALSEHMELRLSNTVRAFMGLRDPVTEAPALVAHAKTLANTGASRADAATLEAMATVLVSVPAAQREAFTTKVLELSQHGAGNSRVQIAQLLAKHSPDAWATLVEACTPLYNVGLYPDLVTEGIEVVLRMSTAASASQVCDTFLQGGLAKAAQRAQQEPNTSDAADIFEAGRSDAVPGALYAQSYPRRAY